DDVTFFFVSSRRRHTSFSRDWSSDVCSSDLNRLNQAPMRKFNGCLSWMELSESRLRLHSLKGLRGDSSSNCELQPPPQVMRMMRSEERRVGKGERRYDWERQ